MRVLLVEDDAMIGEAIQRALKDASYAADWVKNGQPALTTLGYQRYDLVLLDLGDHAQLGRGRSIGARPAVVSSRRDLHPQECAHAGRTKKSHVKHVARVRMAARAATLIPSSARPPWCR